MGYIRFSIRQREIKLSGKRLNGPDVAFIPEFPRDLFGRNSATFSGVFDKLQIKRGGFGPHVNRTSVAVFPDKFKEAHQGIIRR